jgi:hypothetical protein
VRVERALVRARERVEGASVATPRAIEVIHHVICDILAAGCPARSVDLGSVS